MRKLLLLCFLLVASHFAYSNGYQVLLQGNKETAMGNTGVGLMPSASAVFFNPGALGFLERSEIQLGGNLVMGRVNYAPSNSFQQYENRNAVPVPYLYGVYAKDSASRFRAGIGVFAPFGSIVDWEDGWAGRQAVNDLTLAAVYVQPTVAYRINHWLSVGVGLDILTYGHVNLQRSTDFGGLATTEGNVELDGNADLKFGYNLGVFIKPSDEFSIGLNYRSKIDAVVDGGDATFSGFSSTDLTNVSGILGAVPDKFNAEIPLPAVFTVGLGVYPTERLTMAMDVAWVQWSDYDSLNFIFNSAEAYNSRNVRDWKNSFVLHVGAEYKVSDKISARLGFYYDETPVRQNYITAETPDSKAFGYTGGLGIKLSDNFDLDLTLLYLDKRKRRNEVPTGVPTGGINGTFDVNAIIPGFGLSYKFN